MKRIQLFCNSERITNNSKNTIKVLIISFLLIFSFSCDLNKGLKNNSNNTLNNETSFNTIKVNNIKLGDGQIGTNPNGDLSLAYPSNNKSFTFGEFSSPMAVSQDSEVIFSINGANLKEGIYQRTANTDFSPLLFESIPNTIFKVYSLTTFKNKIYAIINIETLLGSPILSGVYELIPSQEIFSLVKKADQDIIFLRFLEYSNKTSGEITSLYIDSTHNQDKYTSHVYRFPDFKDFSPKIKDSQGNIKYASGLKYILGEELGEVIYFIEGSSMPFLTSSTINRSEPITIEFKGFRESTSNILVHVTAVGQAMINNNLSYIASTTDGDLYKLPVITESLKVINFDLNNPDFLINYSNNQKGYVKRLKVINSISYALAQRGTYQLSSIGKNYEPINSIDSFDIKNYNGFVYLLGGEKDNYSTYNNAQILKQLTNKTWQRVL